jgi:hypothetical protein
MVVVGAIRSTRVGLVANSESKSKRKKQKEKHTKRE